ncbi:MAG: hypothetical protein MPK06_05105 [Alphaproteobacteria bacterium]|nr:hypothetical protein [Alphaproteobacteria bacterium]MDA7983848.1 hypothetical protein [Alphaproteobacteria bacterium]MDA7984238.1 hypothetical protein [Alphaproteobacteria bacterium]MDA7987886.1 hypothetical protein [Alphaproteobacteria bacterium]MDA7989480.1 hypothetical protein [Alphaproteobacteria bacterium]
MNAFRATSRRRGVTFIELIGVLVVAIIIIAGALALYSEANTSSRTNQLIVAIGALSGSVRALHANTANYGGEVRRTRIANLASVVVSANAVPPGMLVTRSTGGGGAVRTEIRHAFGGHILVGGMEQNFVVAARNLDEDICIRLSTESTAKASSGLRGVFIVQDTNGPTPTNLYGLNAVADETKDIIDIAQGNSNASVAAGDATFGYTATTGNVSDTAATIPIAPAAAELACETTDNVLGWVYQ